MKRTLHLVLVFMLCTALIACSTNNQNALAESEPPTEPSQASSNPSPQSLPPVEPVTPTEEEPEQEPVSVLEPIPSQEPQPTVPHNGVMVAAGQFASFAVQPDGSLWGWGIWGDIKWGMEVDPPSPTITPMKIMDDVADVAAGGWLDSTVMILQTDGSMWAMGSNLYGQFGDGTTTSRDQPVRVMDDVAHVSVGGFHTMVIKTDGSLWTFGGNWQGQLGDGTTTDRHTPVKVMDDVIAISAGAGHSMAITSDGVLWGWGHNGGGRIGYAATADEQNPIHPSPTRILEDVVQVSAGFDHTLAIRTDNNLWAWGNNSWGWLGVGPPAIPPEPGHLTASPSPTPMQVQALFDVVAISAGNQYSMAITSDGGIWGWGSNEGWVRLGLGDAAKEQDLPIAANPMRIMDDALSVSAWNGHTLIVRTDGSVWAFGDNHYGQIGDGGEYGFLEEGGFATRNSPVPVKLQ